VPGPEEMSRDELLVVVARQAERLEAQDRQIAEMAGQLAQLIEVNEALADKLARLEQHHTRNSGNSSSPPSRDDDPGEPAAPENKRRGGDPGRARGKQPGAPGSHLAWTDDPHERRDRFPQGRCDCGDDLAGR
jgi:transposase